jgi:hypothetical protein
MATIFRGFSTVDTVKAPFSLSDMDLVKRDLLNEFNTRKGERVTEDEIKDDIIRIVEKESRVDLINVSVFSDAHTVRAEVELRYVILNSEDTLYLEFKDEQQV